MKTWKCLKSMESFPNKETPCVSDSLPENCLKGTNLFSKWHFGFSNKKSYFQTSMLGYMGNFEQHFQSCVLNTQNPLKSALNKANGLNTSKNELIKIFCGFPVFKFAL